MLLLFKPYPQCPPQFRHHAGKLKTFWSLAFSQIFLSFNLMNDILALHKRLFNYLLVNSLLFIVSIMWAGHFHKPIQCANLCPDSFLHGYTVYVYIYGIMYVYMVYVYIYCICIYIWYTVYIYGICICAVCIRFQN